MYFQVLLQELLKNRGNFNGKGVCFEVVGNLHLFEINNALQNKEFVIHFQGKWDTNELRFIGYEALCRWHKDGNYLLPNNFIPMINESVFANEFHRFIIRETLFGFQRLSAMTKKITSLSINISPVLLQEPFFIDFFIELILECKINASCIIIELTENFSIDNMQVISASLQQLRSLGIRISLDDFGTGYSSLRYLNEFEIDEVKIDKYFVHGIHKNKKAQALLAGVVIIAKRLGCDVVAEGVEIEAELEIVTQLGCNIIQGFYFSIPKCIEKL